MVARPQRETDARSQRDRDADLVRAVEEFAEAVRGGEQGRKGERVEKGKAGESGAKEARKRVRDALKGASCEASLLLFASCILRLSTAQYSA